MTVAQVAEIYGITPRRVYAIAKARKVMGEKIGNLTTFTPSQVKKLRPAPPGRPRKEH